MVNIRPLPLLTPRPEFAKQVASLPYDVMNRKEARAMAGDNRLCFLHVSRSDLSFSDEVSAYSEEVYQSARSKFKSLVDEGVFAREDSPIFYLYRLSFNARTQTGIVCGQHLDDLSTGKIRIHELTREEKEEDRTRHILTVGAQTGPVFLTFKHTEAVSRMISETISETAPFIKFTADDGVTHEIWKVLDTPSLQQSLSEIPCTYVADGHHRLASAERVRRRHKQQEGSSAVDPQRLDYVMAVLFPDTDLSIMPYNRVLKLDHTTPEQILAQLAEIGNLSKTTHKQPSVTGSVCVYCEGQWYDYRLPQPSASAKFADRLDASVLQTQIFEPLFDIKNPRTSNRVDFIGGIRGTAELERLVDSGDWGIAFSLYPVSIEDLMKVADAGEIMPPKSTWFEPKLRSGLFVNSFDS